MTTPATPSAPKPAGDHRNLVAVDEHYVALTMEDRLHIFWQKNSGSVTALLVVVLLGILAKGIWEYMAAQKEQDLQRDYAAALTSEKLRAFAGAHPDHVLAGIARLRLADEAYAAGKSADAMASYEQAIPILTGPLASRAKLGVAMAKIQSGRTADGEAALKQLAADANEPKATRAEANYQLASLAGSAGRAADVKKYTDQVMQLYPTSQVWIQRVVMLQASTTAAEPAADGVTPAVKLPAPGK